MTDEREIKVTLVGDAKEEFDRLNKLVGSEVSEGIASSEKQTLFNSIKQKIGFLRDNPQYGIHIARNKIPKEYILKYDVNNLWKVNLSGAWRMIYTLRGDRIEILAIILDILSHKDYEKKFGYKKS